MAAKTFDNLGSATGLWETADDWEPEGVPVDNDTIIIDADCSVSTDYSGITFEDLHINTGDTLTIANGATLYFDTGTCDFIGNFTVDTGGLIRFTDIAELETNGLVTIDGGTVEIVETDSSLIQWEVRGTGIIATANGGTIKLVCATQNLAKLYFNGGTLSANAASRLIVDGDSGAAQGLVTLRAGQVLVNADFDGISGFTTLSAAIPTSLDNCLFHNMGTVFLLDEGWIVVANSWIYDNTNGITVIDISYVDFRNVVFGETEGSVSAENSGFDVEINALCGTMHNCKLSSTTPISSGGSEGVDLSFTSYDQGETDWRQYQSRGHLAQAEEGAGAQGGSGMAVKCVSSANAADTDTSRFRRLVAVIPATHGDLIDATLYIKSAVSGKTSTLRIDPDGVYGTTKSVAIDRSNTTYNQETIPQYTVNVSGGAGTKVAIPIYLDMTGASETWYYDTLDWTIS